MNEIAIFTIASGNYFAQVKTLLDSIYCVHNDVDLYYFLADELSVAITENSDNFNVICANQLIIDNFESFSFKYNIIEFNTALKPFCFENLINTKQYKKIIYFDPDIFVFNKLYYIFDLLNNYSILLTPHVGDANFATTNFINLEFLFLKYGIYNLGFIAISINSDSEKLIKWWKKRCYDNCYILKNEVTFVDQKWIDFVPSLFDNVFVIRNLGCNMAYWNIHERILSENFKVNDTFDLLFFHFSGFVLDNPIKITSSSVIRYTLEQRTDLVPIFNIYRKKILENLYYNSNIPEYKYSHFKNGIKITDYHRSIYQYLQEIFPKPFDVNKKSYFHFVKKRKLLRHFCLPIPDFNTEMWLGNKHKSLNIRFLISFFRFLEFVLGSVKFYGLINKSKNFLNYINSNTFLLKFNKNTFNKL